jgi:serine/threonine protein kinase
MSPRFEEKSTRSSGEKVIGNYALQGKLGEGSFGTVHKCRSLLDNQTYVIKQVKSEFDGGGSLANANEAGLMKNLRHKNIVRYVDSFIHGDFHFLVMEYCDRGDLHRYCKRMDRSLMVPESRIWRFFI